MTPIFTPYIETPKELHELREWTRREAERHYARLRRELAEPTEVLEVRLRGPKCTRCEESDPFFSGDYPQISSSSWEEDVALEVGDEEAKRIKAAISAGDDPSWNCMRCHRDLRPWNGDDVYVASKFLEEDFGLDDDTGSKRNPSKATRSLVFEMYENTCFACGAMPPTVTLTIDHIVPRSRGGDAAFKNLQPLCDACQQAKADHEAQVSGVHDNLYFEGRPGDSFEGLFW